MTVACLVVALLSAIGTPAAPPAKLEFNRDIRPILAENCFACHGPDSASRKANLRLDIRDLAIQAEAIIPGDPQKSQLIERICAEEPSQIMPPPRTNKKLTPAQKETLRQWIAAGAEYQPHWSFITPKRPAVPVVKNPAWVKNPIDAFVLAELEKRGLQPAAEADRRTLARRLSLDLTGLPPTPADVEAFVNDKAPDAYERFIDKLLQSQSWGEHRGRYWLDAARYADTHGIHFDNYREMWIYRDWVINAFNQNMPFDKFTIEQLAGDLLPNATLEQRIASGFNRCNITTNEGGAINEEYLVLYARDRTETTSQVWLGLTTGCAVCHAHKFDPISQKEFYELSAYFNNTTQAAMDGNIKDTPPIMPVPMPEDRPKWEALLKQIGDVKQQTDARKKAAQPDFDKWLAQSKPSQLFTALPREGLKFQALLSEGAGSTVTVLNDGQQRIFSSEKPFTWQAGHVAPQAYRSKADAVIEFDDVGDFEKGQGFSFGAWVRLPRNATGAIFSRMDDANAFRGWDLWVEQNKFGSHIVHKWPEDAMKVVTNTAVKPNEWNHVFITYDGSSKVAGLKIYVNGVEQSSRNVQADALKSTIHTEVPFKFAQRSTTAHIDNLGIQDARIYSRMLSGDEVVQLAKGTRAAWLLSKAAAKKTDAEKNELFDWWLPVNDKAYQTASIMLTGLQKEETAIKARGTVAHVMNEKSEEAKAYLLFRGEYDKRRDPVKANTPQFLPAYPKDAPKNRIGLAQWLLRPEHPLTSRVTVNRFWQELFGTGLVRTSGDFGIAGELPSHPELIDWLAVEFREGGWDMKTFFKLLVTSATYRQAALVTPEKLEKDPLNRFYSRGPRFRMDGEMIRDTALAASGLLVKKLGGPSVRPYQPEGVWEAVAMIGSNTRDYRNDKGDALYRRSLYTFWKRAAPPAQMDIFNAPSRETCTVRRERTNTPLQALVTLNDVQFIEAARNLAQLTLKEGGEKLETRLDFLAKRVLARPFRPAEVSIVSTSLNELLGFYQAHADDAKKLIAVGESKADATLEPTALAAWTMLANQVMNLDEGLNK